MTSKKTKLSAITGSGTGASPKTPERLPNMPTSLPHAYKHEWQALVTHMRANDIWVPQKAGLIEAYLMNLKAVREAEAFMQEHGVIMDGGKPNPASAVLVRHTATLNKLAEQPVVGHEPRQEWRRGNQEHEVVVAR